MWSPTRSVFSMDPDGILNACRRRVRTIRAMINATPNASAYSRTFPFLDPDARIPSSAIISLLDLEYGQERLLGNLDGADLLHPLLPFLLLLQELQLPRDVAAVAFRDDVLPDRLHRLPGDDLAADRRLDGHFEHLAGDQLPQALRDVLPLRVGVVPVEDERQGVHLVPVEQDVEPDQVRLLEPEKFVIHRGVPAGGGLQLVVEVENDLVQRQFVLEDDPDRRDELHLPLHAPPLLAQLEDVSQILHRQVDRRVDDRFLDMVEL